MAIWRSPSTEGVSLAIAIYNRVCKSGSPDPDLFGSGHSRTTKVSVVQECPFLPDGDLAIANYRGVVSGDRQLQGLSPARVNVGEGQALALRQQTEVYWSAGVCPPRVFFWVSGAGSCPDGDQAIANYKGVVSGARLSLCSSGSPDPELFGLGRRGELNASVSACTNSLTIYGTSCKLI